MEVEEEVDGNVRERRDVSSDVRRRENSVIMSIVKIGDNASIWQ